MQYQLLNEDLFHNVTTLAGNSARKRSNHNFHQLSEVYQRFLNSLAYGTYVRPHRHLSPPKPETFLVLRGKLGFLLFDDFGNILHKFILTDNGPTRGIDLQPGVWHSIVCLSEFCICFEGKSGPYDPTTDKEFLSGFPEENSSDVSVILNRWEKEFEGLY